ncbi:peroxiredoxin [Herbaspirillum robiniae]|nr:peroxiredoxin [Herbaspirillum robiniae]
MTSGKTFHLADYKGKNLVLYFYPKDNTPGCTTEGMQFRDLHPQFQDLNTEIFGISRDSLKSHESFKGKLGMPFELISDPDETLCTMFDVMKMKNMYGKQVRGVERSTFVIDGSGKVVKEWRGVKVPAHVDEVLAFIKTMA